MPKRPRYNDDDALYRSDVPNAYGLSEDQKATLKRNGFGRYVTRIAEVTNFANNAGTPFPPKLSYLNEYGSFLLARDAIPEVGQRGRMTVWGGEIVTACVAVDIIDQGQTVTLQLGEEASHDLRVVTLSAGIGAYGRLPTAGVDVPTYKLGGVEQALTLTGAEVVLSPMVIFSDRTAKTLSEGIGY